MIFNKTFQCSVLSMGYDFKSKTGFLNMEDGDCCDMSGCITIFKNIDQKVEKIVTFSGKIPDTVYLLHENEWIAADPDTLASMQALGAA